jgi:hypothetical protein
MRGHRVRALLMGGQACVFYGAAEFSRDTDFAIPADAANLARLRNAQLESALANEEKETRVEDKAYWSPLLKELERLRHPR